MTHAAWAAVHAHTAYAKAMADAGPKPDDEIRGALWLAEVLTRASEAIHFPSAAFRKAFGVDAPPAVRQALVAVEASVRANRGPPVNPTAEAKALADLEALAPRPPKTPEEAAAERTRQLEAMERFEEYMADPLPQAPKP
jgi:hypothetical protein